MPLARRLAMSLLPFLLLLAVLPTAEVPAQMGRRLPPADSLRAALRAVGSDSSRMPALLLRLGMSLQMADQQDSAAACFRMVLGMERHANDSVRVIALRQLGAIAIRADRVGEGRVLFERGMHLAQKMGNEDLRYSLMQHVASASQAEGLHAHALALLLECLRYQESRQRSRETAMLHLTIGDLYFKIAAYDQAIRQHRNAIAIFEPHGTSYLLGRAYFMLAGVYQKTGRNDSAETWYAHALRIAREVRDHEGAARTCEQLGHLCLEQGRLIEADEYFRQVFEFTRLESAPIAVAGARRGLALVHLAAGRDARAVEELTAALEIAQVPGTQELRVQLLSDLATVRERMHDTGGALETLRRYTVERDTLLARQNRAQMNELLTRYEAEQREQQILLLEKDNHLRKSELLRSRLLARERAAALELLARENRIQGLTLDLTNAELRAQMAVSLEKEQQLLLATKDSVLRAEVSDRQRLQRNAAIIATAFVIVASVLFLFAMHLRRRASEARAAEAELRADAAQGESLRLRTETAEREKEAQLRFTRDLLRAQEDERQRIASDLHDSLAQKLVVIQNRATLARRQAADHPAMHQQFTRIADTAVETIAEVRAISHALHPQLLQRFGLSSALRNLVEELGEASEVRWTADIDDLADAISPDDAINLYRIVQEGMNNTMRHAAAASGTLTVRRDDTGIHVTLADDGRGCDLAAVARRAANGAGSMGLHGMQRRAELLGALLDITSRPGHGTRITLDMPASAHADTPHRRIAEEAGHAMPPPPSSAA